MLAQDEEKQGSATQPRQLMPQPAGGYWSQRIEYKLFNRLLFIGLGGVGRKVHEPPSSVHGLLSAAMKRQVAVTKLANSALC